MKKEKKRKLFSDKNKTLLRKARYVVSILLVILIIYFILKYSVLFWALMEELARSGEMTLSEKHLMNFGFLVFAFFTLIAIIALVLTKTHIFLIQGLLFIFKKLHIFVVIALLLLFVYVSVLLYSTQRTIYELDRDTKVNVEEKIVIIEIDDYWNIDEEGAGPFFYEYGYTMERYREVSDIIDKYGFNASLGLTPFIFVESTRLNHALTDDEDMITYLKELDSKGYELAMHGYNHCRNQYYCPRYEEIWYNVYFGKMDLETAFKKPFVTYFPPGNQWTTEQYENVVKAGFKTIGNTHVPWAYFDEDVIITHKGYDPIYYYGWYAKDFRHTPVEVWIVEYEMRNLFILQLHCNTFDSPEKLADLDKFLARVKQDGAKVMTYRDFYDYIMEKRQEKKDEK